MSPRRKAATGAAAVLASIVYLAGCNPSQERVTGPEAIDVTGDFGARPAVTFEPPLTVEERSVTVVIDGEGPVLAPGAPVLLDWIAFDGTTGAELDRTWGTAPDVFAYTVESLGEDLFAAVSAAGTNDRVLLLEPSSANAGVPGSRVAVIDVRPARAQGTPVPPAGGLPSVTLADSGAPVVTLPGIEAPAERQEQILIKGDGAQVEADSVLIVQYTVVQWSDGVVRYTTWGEGSLPQTLDLATAVPGLAQGMVDQAVGSQVLLVVPPEEASGDDTLVFVVDILAIVQDEDDAPTTPSPTVTTTATTAPTATTATTEQP